MLEPTSLLPKGSVFKADILIGTLMSVTLVVIGVAASKMAEPLYFGLLILFTLVLISLQYVTWLRSRPAVFRSELEQHLSDRSNLLSVLAEITTHCENSLSFTKSELVIAVRWWWEEDLWTDYHMDLELEEDEMKRRRKSLNGVSDWLRHPGSLLRGKYWSIRRRLVSSGQTHLVEIVHSIPNEQVARIVISRALEERFLDEALVAAEFPSLSRIEYSWTDSVLIQL